MVAIMLIKRITQMITIDIFGSTYFSFVSSLWNPVVIFSFVMKYRRRPSETMSQLSDHMYNIIKSLAEAEGLAVSELTTGPGAPKDANYLGEIVRVKVDGMKEAEAQTLNLIVKLAPNHVAPSVSSINQLFDKELTAYTKILPMLEKCLPDAAYRCLIPKFYKGSKQPGGEYIIMDDLSHNGYKMCDPKAPIDLDHFRVVIKYLANFHAASFILQKKHHGFYDVFSSLITNEVQYNRIEPSLMKKICDNMVDSIDDETNRARLKTFFNNPSNNIMSLLNAEKTAPYNVFAHGDCWTGNFFFKYEADMPTEMLLLDWQTIRLASPVSDLAFFAFVCADGDARSHLPSLLDLYYESLTAACESAGVSARECYPELVFRQQLKEIMPLGLISATIVLPMLLADVFEPDPSSPGDSALLLIPKSERCVRRMEDVVKDCVKYDYI